MDTLPFLFYSRLVELLHRLSVLHSRKLRTYYDSCKEIEQFVHRALRKAAADVPHDEEEGLDYKDYMDYNNQYCATLMTVNGKISFALHNSHPDYSDNCIPDPLVEITRRHIPIDELHLGAGAEHDHEDVCEYAFVELDEEGLTTVVKRVSALSYFHFKKINIDLSEKSRGLLERFQDRVTCDELYVTAGPTPVTDFIKWQLFRRRLDELSIEGIHEEPVIQQILEAVEQTQMRTFNYWSEKNDEGFGVQLLKRILERWMTTRAPKWSTYLNMHTHTRINSEGFKRCYMHQQRFTAFTHPNLQDCLSILEEDCRGTWRYAVQFWGNLKDACGEAQAIIAAKSCAPS